MSEHTDERQGDLEDFVKRSAVVLGAALACIALVTALWKWTPVALRVDVDTLAAKQSADTQRIDRAMLRVIDVVTLQATISAEEPGSLEYEAARAELKRLRRISLAER